MVDSDKAQPNIVVENVHVRYVVRTNKKGNRTSARTKFSKALTGDNGRRETTTVRALRGVNLVACEGEMVGIVGANGSGKSTLLRNIAGVEQPDRGRILARYQPVLLGVSAALQPGLSGGENIRLGCLAMGLSPQEAAASYEYVTELSALGDAINRPMATYSSGMAARLRFAIALAARPRVLLIDEALSTGDATFAERSEQAMGELLKEAGTVFLVSHAAKTIQELCTRAVWMHRGEIILDGAAEEVAERYRWWAWNVAKGEDAIAEKLIKDVLKSSATNAVKIVDPLPQNAPSPRHARRKVRLPNSRNAGGMGWTHSAEIDKSIGARPHTETPRDSVVPNNGEAHVSRHRLNPKPASEAIGTHKGARDGYLKLRPGDSRVILRAADPKDRASTVANEMDLTSRRQSAQTQRSLANKNDNADRPT